MKLEKFVNSFIIKVMNFINPLILILLKKFIVLKTIILFLMKEKIKLISLIAQNYFIMLLKELKMIIYMKKK